MIEYLITRFAFIASAIFLVSLEPSWAQDFRKEDQDLFSENYQNRILQTILPNEHEVQALQDWATEITRILAQPKDKRPTEKDLQELFFTDFFGKALGYTKRGANQDQWTLQSETRTDIDASRPDGVLGYFSHDRQDVPVRVIIELKSPGVDLDLRQNRKQDRRTPVDQAFSYAHKFENVEWVIVSNFDELRLYHASSSKYALHFKLSKLTENDPNMRLLLGLLRKENLISLSGTATSTAFYQKREEELHAISEQFYRDYKKVRLATAESILSNNNGVSVDLAVSYAQVILDRILFIAFLEDLSLIPTETIEKAYLTQNNFNPSSRWDNFRGLFKAMDQGNPSLRIPAYNGGLFRSSPGILDLDLPDSLFDGYKTLADYDFRSDLRVNILGRVFEQSITDIDVLKATLRGEISEDTRRHDEGAHYTPESVTTYVIDRTLGVYLQDLRSTLGFDALPEMQEAWRSDTTNKTRQKHIAFWESYAERLKGLKIVDPSCGSGAFLVAAFDYLEAEGHRVNKELDYLHAPRLFSNWDREIVKNNLYGVDLSPEAAEITRLSLWLKIAKNKEKLVALDHTIRAGNAVISNPEHAGELAFDWHAAFPEVMGSKGKKGGFDIVIGNPPYVRHELITDLKPSLEDNFSTFVGTADLYVYFYELGLNLLKEEGYLGYITSNKWMRAKYGLKLRRLLRDHSRITHLIDLGEDDIFDDAVTYTNIIMLQKKTPGRKDQIIVKDPPFAESITTLAQMQLTEDAFQIRDPIFYQTQEKIESVGPPLADWETALNRGITTGFNDAFIIDIETRERLISEDPNSERLIKPFLSGRDIERWHYEDPEQWIIFTRRGTDIDSYPAIKRHLNAYFERLKPKQKGDKLGRKPGPYAWYEIQDSTEYFQDFEGPKLIWAKTAPQGQFMFDTQGFYLNATSFYLSGMKNSTEAHFLAAILNSTLAFWYLEARGSILSGGFVEFVTWLVERMPIPKLSPVEQVPFAEASRELHRLAGSRYALTQDFLALLRAEFGLVKASSKLQQWHKYDFKSFLLALKKAQIHLEGDLKEDWFARFSRKQAEIEEMDKQIKAIEHDLNTRIFNLYGLTEDERAQMY